MNDIRCLVWFVGLAALCGGGCHSTTRSEHVAGPHSTTAGTSGAQAPIVVPRDPPSADPEHAVVCVLTGDVLPREEARSARYASQTYYFCSERCRKRFLANPEYYLNRRR